MFDISGNPVFAGRIYRGFTLICIRIVEVYRHGLACSEEVAVSFSNQPMNPLSLPTFETPQKSLLTQMMCYVAESQN